MTSSRLRLLASAATAAILLAPSTALAQLTVAQGQTQFSSGGQAPVIVGSSTFTDVTLQAPRTVIGWSSYNLGSDAAVVYRFGDASWIVLNKVAGSALIDGNVEALVGSTRRQGNVWFAAPGGVVFGGNARVNVGALFATTGTVDMADFLNASGTSFRVTGSSGSVQVGGGAQITTGGGAVALISGSVGTGAGSTIQAGTAMFGAASDFTVRFAPGTGGLDLLDFVVPASGGSGSSAPLSLAGQTLAGTVIAAVVNRAEVASSVISAPGLLAAQTAFGSGGDVILTAGVDILGKTPGTARTNSTTQTTANVGIVSAQRDVLAGFSQPTTLNATQLSAGRDVGLLANVVDVGSLNATRLLAIDAGQSINVRNQATAGSNATLRAGGAVTVPGTVDVLGRLQIDAATVTGNRLSAGRSITVNASGAGIGAAPTTAAVNLGQLIAEDDISITTTNATGSIFVGNAAITGARGDDQPAGRNFTLRAMGANADVNYGGGGGTLLTGPTVTTFSAGRDIFLNVQGLLSVNAATAGRAVVIRAGDLDILGAISGASVRIESLAGALTLGGSGTSSAANSGPSAGAEGLAITDAEFQRIQSTGDTSFYSGSTISSTAGDLTVRDLTVTPSRTPRLILGARTGNDVIVTGVAAPTVNGGALTIGDPNDSAFRPGRILVSGALGAASGNAASGFTGVRAFDTVSLNADRDVILGSQRFISLVANASPATVNIARDQPSGATAIAGEQDRIFITAGTLTLNGTVRILQQNSGTAAAPNGLFLANMPQPVATVLTVAPAQVVDLFGSFRDQNGQVQSSLSTRSGGGVLVNGALTSGVRVNGCEVAGGCGSQTVSTTLAQTTQVLALAPASPAESSSTSSASSDSGSSDSGGGGDEGGGGDDGGDDGGDEGGGESRGPSAGPPLMTVAPPDLSVEQSDPVTIGAGSDELWRSRAVKPPTPPKPPGN